MYQCLEVDDEQKGKVLETRHGEILGGVKGAGRPKTIKDDAKAMFRHYNFLCSCYS